MPTSPTQDFLELITSLDRSKSTGEKFRDFCNMSYCSLAKLTADQDKAVKLEAQYMTIVDAHHDKDAVRGYPQLLAFVSDGVSQGEDVLGAIAAAEHVLQQGFDPAQQMLVHAVELNRLSYKMTFIQRSLKGIPAYVEHANTLSFEHFGGAWTTGARLFHEKHSCLFPKHEQPRSGEPPAPTNLSVLTCPLQTIPRHIAAASCAHPKCQLKALIGMVSFCRIPTAQCKMQ